MSEQKITVKTFEEAVKFIGDKTKKPKKTVPSERKLALYGLFKQSNVGDVTGSQPWMINVEARAKWDAWAQYKGLTKDEAKKKYVEEVNSQITEFEVS
ncbi:hypothetical protein AAMO2058_000522700 [Amorphochlora amoebiformis]|mmetsp:Transcript_4644/g.7075  ORF Transcript_4644/g.7075 Transcript_4644/m.7075 type:complete len:98 (+) Transcript_4644:53-346(+)